MLSSAEITAMTSTVASSLDQTLPLYRKTTTTDGYGHSVETYPSQPTLQLPCNTFKASASVLQVYAGIIAGKKAEMLRYMQGMDVREGDRIVKDGLNWRVQPLITRASYSFSNTVLITEVG